MKALHLMTNKMKELVKIKSPCSTVQVDKRPNLHMDVCIYRNQCHPANENQSDGRTETINFHIFKSSQSNLWYMYKAMK